MNLSNATGNATITDAQGVGTIVNDDVPATDGDGAEPDRGQPRAATRCYGHSAPPDRPPRSTSRPPTRRPRSATTPRPRARPSPRRDRRTITVGHGDTTRGAERDVHREPVDATGNATIADGQAPARSTTMTPPRRTSRSTTSRTTRATAGTTAYVFTVSLSAAQAAPVTVDFATANGTATAASDYTANSGTLTFAPGVTTQTVTVQVNGDTTVEPNETFNVNLSDATGNATIADAQGVGTIVNDDAAARRPSRSTTSRTEGNSGHHRRTSSRSPLGRRPGRAGDGRLRDRRRHGDRAAATTRPTSGTLDLRPRRDHARRSPCRSTATPRSRPTRRFTVNLSSATATRPSPTPRASGTIVNDDAAAVARDQRRLA